MSCGGLEENGRTVCCGRVFYGLLEGDKGARETHEGPENQ